MKIAPLPSNESARLASLASYALMDTEQDKDYDDLTELAAEICQTPIALISFIDEERQWFKSKFGTDATETKRDYAFCSHTILQHDEVLVITDTTKDERFFDNPLVTGITKIKFYAGVPLVNEAGYALGTICVVNTEQKQLSDYQIKALKIIGKQVVNQIELKKKIQESQYTNAELLESYSFIENFAERIAHDIKSSLTSIILSSQSLQAALIKLGNERLLKLNKITLNSGENLSHYLDELLHYSALPNGLQAQNTKEDFELIQLIRKVITLIRVPNNYKIKLPQKEVFITYSKIALEQVFLNLISNAIRYNDKPKPIIEIKFTEDYDNYAFEVSDNGRGISAAHLEDIYKKGFFSSEPDRYQRNGTGIGLNIVKKLIDQTGGKITVTSEVGVGTTFSISLPKLTAN